MNVLQNRIERVKGGGLDGLLTSKELREQLEVPQAAIDELQRLGINSPSHFQELVHDPTAQAQWLKRQVDAFSNLLMNDGDTTSSQYNAFAKKFCALPAVVALQGIPTVSLNRPALIDAAVAYAEIIGRVVLNAHFATVVDGLYYDGQACREVKIKLRHVNFTGIVNHEFKMLNRLHKHAPSVVVTPFAIVKQADR